MPLMATLAPFSRFLIKRLSKSMVSFKKLLLYNADKTAALVCTIPVNIYYP